MENKNFIKFSLRLKFSLLISFLITFVVFIIGYRLINFQKKKLTEELLKRGGVLAKNLSYIALESYAINDVMSIIVYCKNLLKEEGVKEAFFITKDGFVVAHSDTKKITYKPLTGVKDKNILKQFKPSEYYNTPFFQKGADLKPGEFDFQLYKDGKLYDIFSGVRFKNKYFGTTHIIFSRDLIFETIKESKRQTIYITFITILIGIIGSLILSSSIANPIKKLAKGADIIGTGNLNHKIVLRSRDEIGFLASKFNNMTIQLKEAQDELIEKEKIENEMEIASDIQHMLLPKKFPEFNVLEFGAFYKAANEVGGDYYDFIKISKDKLCIVMADVSGKGIPGSLVMTMFRSILRSTISPELNAYETLCKINQIIHPDIIPGMFVTVFYGILDLKHKILNFANAGHSHLLIYNSVQKKLKYAKSDGFPVGVVEDQDFRKQLINRNLKININDLIVQNTDGVNEAMNNKKDLFGDERFYSAIRKYGNLYPQKFIKLVINDILEFTQGARQNDDITLVGVKMIS